MARSTKKLLGALSASAVITVVLIGTILAGGVAVAVPASSIGGFHSTIETTEAQDMALFPTTGQTSQCPDNTPLIMGTIAQAEMTNIKFMKDLPIPGTEQYARITIKGDPNDTVTVNNVKMKISSLEADVMEVTSEMSATESYEGDTFATDPDNAGFVMAGEEARIENALIRAHSVTINSLELTQPRLDIEFIEDSDRAGAECGWEEQ